MKIKNTLLASLIFASTAITPFAMADDDTGFFIGVAANKLSADFEDERDVEFDDSDTAASIRAGYIFNNLLGIELGYLDLGEYFAEGDSRNNRIDLDADALSAALVLNWTVHNQIDLYGKLGVFQLNVDSDSFVAGARLQQNDEETEVFGAFGIDYDIGAVNFFAEISIADTDINELSIDIATAGIKYEFGSY